MSNPHLTPNDPLRRAFEASDLTAAELGKRVGIIRSYGQRPGYKGGDTTAVKRDLGLAIQTGRNVAGQYRRAINPAKALRYAAALGLDPADLDL